MKKGLILIVLLAVSIMLPAAEAEIVPLPINGFSSEGVFKLFKNESEIGTITYKLSENGEYSRHFTLAMAGQELELDYTISADEQGLWTSMKIVAPTETVTVVRKGDKAEYTLKSKDTSYSVNLTADHLIYDNYGPVFESLMLREYDMEKKGKQTFSRFIAPATSLDVDLEYKEESTRTVADKQITFQVYDMTIAGIGVEIWADKEGEIYLMDVPIQYAAFVREGYLDLMKSAESESAGPISKAEYELEKESVMITMRDGVKLATDLYIPKGEEKVWPTVLVRTPYKKEMEQLTGEFWARRGYLTAIQDCRGRFSSEGVWEPFINEAKDGYDTIEWLGTQAWSSGKVGMIGGSYVGWVQLWAAAEKPPHLTTIIPNVAPPDPFYNIPYEYGSFFIFGSIWWAEILETEATADLSGKAISKIADREYQEVLLKLPVIDLDKEIFGKENSYWRKWIKHNTNDSYWEPANFMEKLRDVEIPVFLQSGWFDGDGIGSKLNYMALKEAKNSHIKLVLGPWGHTGQSSTTLGEYEFGEEAGLDLRTLYVRWFDCWLKGIENGIDKEPLVQLFSMFSNQWHTADTYPLPETTFTKFYLSSSSGANTSRGDGKLSAEWSEDERDYDKYTYNPKNPTPWPDFYYKSKKEIEEEKKGTVDIEKRREKAKAFHREVTDSRKDILVYQTDPLKEPITVVGPMSTVLYASSSAVDTDWFVSIADINEEGEIFPLARGTIRARFRNSTKKPELLEKKKVYEYTIDLWQTGITFEKGHRICIEIASALFPAFSRNLNTGGHNEMDTKYKKAKQKIYHSEEYPSYLLLPVIELEVEDEGK